MLSIENILNSPINGKPNYYLRHSAIQEAEKRLRYVSDGAAGGVYKDLTKHFVIIITDDEDEPLPESADIVFAAIAIFESRETLSKTFNL